MPVVEMTPVMMVTKVPVAMVSVAAMTPAPAYLLDHRFGTCCRMGGLGAR